MADLDDFPEQHEVRLVPGLSAAQQAEAQRIFAALNESRA